MRTYKGVLDWHFETGCEGLIWMLEADDKSVGWKGVIFLQAGDRLKVFNEKNEIIFDEELVLDTRTGYHPYPANPESGQQAALGMWIHWIQKGWQPDDWARLFVKKEGEALLRAELTTGRKI